MEGLPRETVSDILSRLSVKDLMRCKCVCKLWFDLVTDSHFISNHYLCYNSLEENLLLIRTPNRLVPVCAPVETKISILSWNPNEPNGLVSSHVLNPPPNQCGYWSYIMGPCNGIYFLYGHPNIIMNPSLRKFITLPPRPHFSDPVETSFFSRRFPRFGFDPITNDYKVVIVMEGLIGNKVLETKFTVELYSFNSNSWKIVEDNPIPFPFTHLSDSSMFFTFVNNCCHWWGCLRKSNKDESDDVDCAVLSFDMVSESFRMIKMPKMPIITPPSVPRDHSNLVAMIIMSDKNIIPFSESTTIGIIDCYTVGQATETRFCFDVWMLKDYWDEGSWIKLYSVSPMPVICRRLLGYHGSNRYLWKKGLTSLVLSALDRDENTRDLLVCGEHESIAAVRYRESLVSLQR